MKHYDWAEPGDPPSPKYHSVRANPLAKPVVYPSVDREDELEFIRRYHEDGDLEALERLVGAHRPMVVRMAKHRWRGNGTSLATLIECGMLGLRIAAAPPRPSHTKKGKQVGFDPARGHRFSTYARNYADKEMRAALADDPGPALNPEFEQKATALIETWGEASEEEWEKEEEDPPLDPRGRLLLIRDLRFRSAYHKPFRPWSLWNAQGPARKPRPRNFRKQPITARELQCRDAFYGRCFASLQTHQDTAAMGIEGWEDGEAEARVMWFPSSGAFDRKLYGIPKAVLSRRWRFGCKRQARIVPYKSNQGLVSSTSSVAGYEFTRRKTMTGACF